MNKLKVIILTLLILLGNICTVNANSPTISLNQNITVEGEFIRIKDVFRGNPNNSEEIIAKAPLPGKKFTFDMDWANNIALRNKINWKPLDRHGLISIERSSTKIEEDEITLEILEKFVEIDDNDIEIDIYGGKTEYNINKGSNYKILIEKLKTFTAKNRFSCTIVIYVDGKEFSKDTIAGKYYTLKDIPVAANNIAKNTIIKADMVKNLKVRKNKIKPSQYTEIEDIIGKETKKSIKENKFFSNNDIREPIIINRGDIVSIIYKTKNMKLTAKAEAIEDGSKGQNIKVMNTNSKKILHCRIIDKNTVEIIK